MQALNALELYEPFNNDGVTPCSLYEHGIDFNDLIKNGVPLDKAHQIDGDLQTLKSLQQKLKDGRYPEIHHKLLKIGHISEDLNTINDDVLRKIGYTFPQRKEFLNKIKATQMKGNLIH